MLLPRVGQRGYKKQTRLICPLELLEVVVGERMKAIQISSREKGEDMVVGPFWPRKILVGIHIFIGGWRFKRDKGGLAWWLAADGGQNGGGWIARE